MADGRSAWAKINKRKLLERFAVEIGPALVFAFALRALGLVGATLAFIAALTGAALYSWFEKRHVPIIPFAMVGIAAVFGGLTIVTDEAVYIEVRATVVNAVAASAILVGLLSNQLLLKRSLEEGFSLKDDAWRTLSMRMAFYLFCLAAANEVVWRNFSTETWALFKACSPFLNLAFLAANWPLIRDNISGEGELRETPPAGSRTVLNPVLPPEPERAGRFASTR